MERFDKIMTGILLVALIAVLSATGRGGKLAGVRLNVSAEPENGDRGPAYLLSNLPDSRRNDDYAVPVSIFHGKW